MNDFLQLFFIPLGVTILGSFIFWIFSNRKKDYKITCEQLSSRQYKEKESDNVKISLTYKNEQVGDSLSVMTVRLANNGKKDIAFSQVFEDKIQVSFDGAKIIDIQIEKESEKVAAVVEKSDLKGWLLSWGILKRKEFIILRVISILTGEGIDDNADVTNLKFDFRGNNLSEIGTIGSQTDRFYKRVVFFVCALLLAMVALMPLRTSVQYDVIVQGQHMQNVDVLYNEYTRNYIVKKAGEPSINTKGFQNISVSKQPVLSTDVRIFIVIVAIYIISFIIFAFVIGRRKLLSFFGSLIRKSE